MKRMHNVETGKYVAVPDDEKGIMKLKRAGFSVVEMLVDTALHGRDPDPRGKGEFHLGRLVPFNAENDTGAAAILQALGKRRTDPGHEEQRQFMRPEEWERLSEKEKIAHIPDAKPNAYDPDLNKSALAGIAARTEIDAVIAAGKLPAAKPAIEARK